MYIKSSPRFTIPFQIGILELKIIFYVELDTKNLSLIRYVILDHCEGSKMCSGMKVTQNLSQT